MARWIATRWNGLNGDPEIQGIKTVGFLLLWRWRRLNGDPEIQGIKTD